MTWNRVIFNGVLGLLLMWLVIADPFFMGDKNRQILLAFGTYFLVIRSAIPTLFTLLFQFIKSLGWRDEAGAAGQALRKLFIVGE